LLFFYSIISSSSLWSNFPFNILGLGNFECSIDVIFRLTRFLCLCVCVNAAVILPVVQKQHQLLVTLLLCNAAAMEVIGLQCFFISYRILI
jgi:hypothetical protein